MQEMLGGASVHFNIGRIVQESECNTELRKPTVLNVMTGFINLKKDIA